MTYNFFMKKFSVLYLIVIFIIIFVYSFSASDYHKVLKVVNANEFYVDFNNNNVADINELVVLEAFAYQPLTFSKEDNFCLKYFGIEYAKKHLLNKFVKIVRNEDSEPVVILLNGQVYSDMLEQDGVVLNANNREVVLKNIEATRLLDLVAYNKSTGKYHELSCKYVFDSPFFEIVKRNDIKDIKQPCKICIQSNANTSFKYPKDVNENYLPVYKDEFIEFYVTDFTKHYYPSKKCLTTVCKSLLNEINNAKKSIDFAIYGIDGQPEIVNALINAQKRGVAIRWVYDCDKSGSTIYSDSLSLAKVLQNNRKDIDLTIPANNTNSTRDAIMHNKFFIFDDSKVWTGSANISKTDLSGFNANSAILLFDTNIAQLFKTEFEKMYSGSFHRLKSKSDKSTFNVGNSIIDVAFSPQDNAIQYQIVPLIDNAQKYVYVPVFVVTHKLFIQSLINAHKRGVDVRLVLDATSASGKYSSVNYLRDNGILLKVENRAGKMHMKSIVIDDIYTVVGSMNFTKSGEKYNDENVVIINNSLLAKAFKDKFLYFWNNIPDKWLTNIPIAESLDSINACFDGIDNDFDGKIDNQDEGCFISK